MTQRTVNLNGYMPYQVVALKDGSGSVELMSYPNEGTVFARRVIGDPTSAEYIKIEELGMIEHAFAGEK